MSAIAWHTVDEVATKGDLAALETRLIRTIANRMVTILVAVIGAIVGRCLPGLTDPEHDLVLSTHS